MHYTKKERKAAYKPDGVLLTINKLMASSGIPLATIQASTYTTNGYTRIRLINSDTKHFNVPSLYSYSSGFVDYLQRFINVGPFTTEYIANSPKATYRRLDLYLDATDINSLKPDTPLSTYPLPEVLS